MGRKLAGALLLSCAALAVLAGVFFCNEPAKDSPKPPALTVKDAPYEPGPQDMQLPELPTGCEATAMSTLLRLNGVNVSKTEVADAMPRSDTDFVDAFLGDPRSPNGGCCMSPCAADTARKFLVGRGLLAYQTEGRELTRLPKPCAVWVTVGLADAQGPIKTQGAYEMYYPSHCVTVLEIVGGWVRVIDPLEGLKEYPIKDFCESYKALGSQAVYLAKE